MLHQVPPDARQCGAPPRCPAPASADPDRCRCASGEQGNEGRQPRGWFRARRRMCRPRQEPGRRRWRARPKWRCGARATPVTMVRFGRRLTSGCQPAERGRDAVHFIVERDLLREDSVLPRAVLVGFSAMPRGASAAMAARTKPERQSSGTRRIGRGPSFPWSGPSTSRSRSACGNRGAHPPRPSRRRRQPPIRRSRRERPGWRRAHSRAIRRRAPAPGCRALAGRSDAALPLPLRETDLEVRVGQTRVEIGIAWIGRECFRWAIGRRDVASRLDEHHLTARILAEPRGQNAAGRAAADDDGIQCRTRHRAAPAPRRAARPTAMPLRSPRICASAKARPSFGTVRSERTSRTSLVSAAANWPLRRRRGNWSAASRCRARTRASRPPAGRVGRSRSP